MAGEKNTIILREDDILTTEALIAQRPKGEVDTSGAGMHDGMGGPGGRRDEPMITLHRDKERHHDRRRRHRRRTAEISKNRGVS